MKNTATIKNKKLEEMLFQAAKKFISKKEAVYFAKEQVDTYLKRSHNINSLKSAIADLEAWVKNPDAKIETQVDKKASLLLNFNKLGPSLKLKFIHDELEKRAKKFGIALIGINNSAGIDTLSLWTDGLAKRDLIGMCFFNGGPGSVVPYGGSKPIFGTNPMSYAIPTGEKPILCDMATSEVPFYKWRKAKEENRLLKEKTIVDGKGNPTEDPKKARTEDGNARILPMGGGYKGYAIVLLVEVLTGSLVRSFLSATEKSSAYIPEEYGGLIIAIDIASFTDLKKFKQSVSAMCKAIRKQKPAKGIDKVCVPGDLSYKKAENLLKKGSVEVDRELIVKLNKLALQGPPLRGTLRGKS